MPRRGSEVWERYKDMGARGLCRVDFQLEKQEQHCEQKSGTKFWKKKLAEFMAKVVAKEFRLNEMEVAGFFKYEAVVEGGRLAGGEVMPRAVAIWSAAGEAKTTNCDVGG